MALQNASADLVWQVTRITDAGARRSARSRVRSLSMLRKLCVASALAAVAGLPAPAADHAIQALNHDHLSYDQCKDMCTKAIVMKEAASIEVFGAEGKADILQKMLERCTKKEACLGISNEACPKVEIAHSSLHTKGKTDAKLKAVTKSRTSKQLVNLISTGHDASTWCEQQCNENVEFDTKPFCNDGAKVKAYTLGGCRNACIPLIAQPKEKNP